MPSNPPALKPSGSGQPPATYRPFSLLRAGDRVALVSPSSHLGRHPAEFLEQAAAILTGWGLRPDPLPQPEPRHMYLAGPDADRAAAFQTAYLDPAIQGLFFTRGGYGAARLLPLLDGPRLAQAQPKPVVGFSDATALFGFLQKEAGLQTVHGPCLAQPGALTAPRRAESLESLRRLLMEPGFWPAFELRPLGGQPLRGPVSGPLVGGCLSVLLSALATPWQVNTQGALLFLEDIDEPPYKMDRMLTQLSQAGLLSGVRGLVFGHLSGCQGEPPGLLEEVLKDLLGQAPFPVYQAMQAGHGDPNLAFPLGGWATLAPSNGAQDGEGAARLAFGPNP